MKKIKTIMEAYIKSNASIDTVAHYLASLNYMDSAYAEAFLIDAYGEDGWHQYSKRKHEILKNLKK